MTELTFKQFADINLLRCEQGFNHPLSAWSLSDWGVAMAGEAGEVCDVIKKLNRIRDGFEVANMGKSKEDLENQLCDEIGDVLAYLDLLAQKHGTSLEECVVNKFNKVSDRLDCKIKI